MFDLDNQDRCTWSASVASFKQLKKALIILMVYNKDTSIATSVKRSSVNFFFRICSVELPFMTFENPSYMQKVHKEIQVLIVFWEVKYWLFNCVKRGLF